MQTSQGYIIRILQHFATKLWNITNFVMLFQAVVKFQRKFLDQNLVYYANGQLRVWILYIIRSNQIPYIGSLVLITINRTLLITKEPGYEAVTLVTLVLHLVSIWSQSLSHDLSHQKYDMLELKIRGVIITREYLRFMWGSQV